MSEKSGVERRRAREFWVRGVGALLALVILGAGSGAVAAPGGEHSDGEDRDGHYCDGCAPPLTDAGGPTMDASGDGIVVTPIFWAPPTAAPFPAGYTGGIERYLSDVAADSGTTANVYSLTPEYGVDYRIAAGPALTDQGAFPADGCRPDDGVSTTCVTDEQLRDELRRLRAAGEIAPGLDRFYPVLLPPGVETQDRDSSTSASGFCGYHRMFGDGDTAIVYGNEPFEATNCDAGQAPNGSAALDGAISTLSHEVMEAITDPDADSAAWLDATGHEIGDLCAEDYGTAAGSTDPANPYATEYNQVINGHPYYTQTEFSNASFAHYGAGFGCAQSADQATTDPSRSPDDVAQIFGVATPNVLGAGDEASLEVTVIDRAGGPVAGDRLSFSTYAVRGEGACGEFSESSASTDDAGHATVTYTASGDPVVCALVALEAKGGYSTISRVYQGDTAGTAPRAEATFPRSIEAGGDARFFTATFANPGSDRVEGARVEFDVFPADGSRTVVDASQLHLAYSLDGGLGPFVPVALDGSTAGAGVVNGYVEPSEGISIAPHGEQTVTFRLTLDGEVPTSAKGPQLSLEAFLDEVNAATGAGTTVADTYATDVRIAPASAWIVRPRILSAFGVAAGFVVLVLMPLAIVRLVRSRRGARG